MSSRFPTKLVVSAAVVILAGCNWNPHSSGDALGAAEPERA